MFNIQEQLEHNRDFYFEQTQLSKQKSHLLNTAAIFGFAATTTGSYLAIKRNSKFGIASALAGLGMFTVAAYSSYANSKNTERYQSELSEAQHKLDVFYKVWHITPIENPDNTEATISSTFRNIKEKVTSRLGKMLLNSELIKS